MQAVILAAGKGKRLQPMTLKRSKAMAPVVGKPMVERVMETLVENHIREFIMVVSQEDSEVERHFREQSDLDVTIQFVLQPERLGMAHALGLAAPYIHDTFIMSACDNLVSPTHIAELIAAHQARSAQATLSLMEIELSQASRTGVVEWREERVWRIVEKPTPAEAPSNISSLPLYVFSPQLLSYLPAVKPSPRGEYELQDAIQMLIDASSHVTGVLAASRMQLTNSSDLLDLNRHYLSLERETLYLNAAHIGPGAHLIAPLRIETGVTIGPGCVVGPRVYIEHGCRIGANVVIRDAVVLRNSVVEEGRRIMSELVHETGLKS
jgi:bifunctional UDP-N-acetylglucosamine pyrophosphorylase/glucosamine-1-phosphate N-acetyltransferase